MGKKRCDLELPVAGSWIYFFSPLAGNLSDTTALLNGVNLSGEPLESYHVTKSMVPNAAPLFSFTSFLQEKTTGMW